MDMAGQDKQLPVFVFPSNITFYTSDQSTYKQIVTLYNPYDFHLRFKVLSTAPHKYSVVDSDGVVKSRCCVDIVVRHNEVIASNEGLRDKFRIHISACATRRTLGCKDIVACLLPRKETVKEERFQNLPEMQRTTPPAVQQTFTPMVNPSKANVVIMLTAASCVIALLLPNQIEDSSLPGYLRISLNQKLVAAYILGLVTMVLLRS